MNSLSSNCGKCTGKQIRCGFAFEKSNLMFPKSLLVRPGLATYVVTAFIVHNLRLGNVVIKYKNYKIKGKLNSFWKSTKVFVIKSFDLITRGRLNNSSVRNVLYKVELGIYFMFQGIF